MRARTALFPSSNDRNGQDILQQALALLRRAKEYALQAGSDTWQFAVEIAELRQLGLTNCDFRWLVARGCVAHALETTLSGDEHRIFVPLGRHMYPDGTCFILKTGMQENPQATLGDGGTFETMEAERCGLRTNGFNHPNHPGGTNGYGPFSVRGVGERTGDALCPAQPHWDPHRRELRVGGVVVKRFRWPAANQETILAVFQEEGWPDRVDDPLPVVPEQDPKRRLHDTIKCLNRNQLNDIVHFRGDGTGEGVSWELTGGRDVA